LIVDTHVHLYDPSRLQGVPWPDKDNPLLYRTVLPDDVENEAGPHGVGGALVVEASVWTEDNQWVLDIAAAHPFIVGLVGRLEPTEDSFLADLERFAADPLFCGIRFWGDAYAPEKRDLFLWHMQQVADRGLVLDAVFPRGVPEGFFTLLEEVPDLPVIIEHVAQARIDGQVPHGKWAAAIERAAAFPQVYMKVSALMECSGRQPAPASAHFYAPLLDFLWEVFGRERLIFGSNWPVCQRAGDYGQCVDIVKSYFATKGPQADRRYFYDNAKRVYRWP
jgi:L-fuconolactonase